MGSDDLLTIILVNWNGAELLPNCLESLARVMPALPPTETIIIDNASTDHSISIIRQKFPWVRLLQNSHNVGFAKANNQAIQQSQGDYILLLNTDTILLSHSLPPLLELMHQNPQIGIIGPTLLNPDHTFQSSACRFPTLLNCALQLLGLSPLIYGAYFPSATLEASQIPQPTQWVSGACLLVRREMIEQIGLLDEQFFMYMEEVDWCYRTQQAGWQVYHQPHAQIIHLGGGSSAKVKPYVLARQWLARLRFFQKYHPAWQTVCLHGLVRGLGFLRFLWFTIRWMLSFRHQKQWQTVAQANWYLYRLEGNLP